MAFSTRRTAVHEAGHTAIALAFRLDVVGVDLSGLTRLRTAPDSMDCLRFKLGGPAAETIAFAEYDPDTTRSDLADADREAWDITHDLAECDALVQSTLSEVTELLDRHWSSLQRIALSLLRRPNVLSGDDLQALVTITPTTKDVRCPA